MPTKYVIAPFGLRMPPEFRLTTSRKAPMMVSAETLGAWIDKNEAEARALWEKGQV